MLFFNYYFTLINRTGLGWIRMHICLLLKTAATACEQSRSARPRLPSHASEWPHLETGGAYSESGSAEPDRVGRGDTVIVCFVLFFKPKKGSIWTHPLRQTLCHHVGR